MDAVGTVVKLERQTFH